MKTGPLFDVLTQRLVRVYSLLATYGPMTPAQIRWRAGWDHTPNWELAELVELGLVARLRCGKFERRPR